MRKISYIVIAIFFLNTLAAQNIKVNIFSTKKINSIIFSSEKGEYIMIADNDTVITVSKKNVLNLFVKGDSVEVRGIFKSYGTYKKIDLIATDKYNYFRIKTIVPVDDTRAYDDNLSIWNDGGNLILVNDVYLENYVAGVVQSESGIKATLEYYKTQAILCRTFALKIWNKFIDDGYNVNDNVNCQVYFGKATRNYEIVEAAYATKDMVIVDSTNHLIMATFYSNCGGETANSEDVWQKRIYYLRSVSDTFCLHSRNSVWQKTISKYKWEQYLKMHGFSIQSDDDYSFKQSERKKYYRIGNDSVLTTDIRFDWKLKSAFFDIVQTDGKLIFNGKGYGHGVGFCQEGAMEMSKVKFNYIEILNYYYTGIKIVNLFMLPKMNLPVSINEIP